jgi:hypothetical protein
MLYAFIEGLVGIQDTHKCLEKIRLSPRWHAAGITEAEANVGYEVSDSGVGYSYKATDSGIQLNLEAKDSQADLHLLIPADAEIQHVRLNGMDVDAAVSTVRDSKYVDCQIGIQGGADLQVVFK